VFCEAADDLADIARDLAEVLCQLEQGYTAHAV